MNNRIHELLHRNLQQVFGEGDAARRRAAIDDLYTEDCVLEVPPGAFIGRDALDKFAGDPLDPKTIIGPIITPDAVKIIDDRVKQAIAKGAKAHTGARRDGQIHYPTILTDVPLDAAIANEETFGPVVVVEVVDTPDEAIAAANRTLYGLTSSILAGNTYRAFEMAPKILAGIVNVNSPTVNDEIHAPMGGVRDSGWGRTGPRSLEDFSDVIWINSHSGQRQYPF
jgi:acyl-CoA reductase-like NAD-dependent aldehyde dehydrogenase